MYFHYTCEHGRAALGDRGRVQPLAVWNPGAARRLPPLAAVLTQLSWFTDLDTPWPREALGLTRALTVCDRTTHRYRALSEDGITPWLGSAARLGSPLSAALELAPGALPRHWFIASAGVPVELAPMSARV